MAQTVHYVPPGVVYSECGWPVHSYKYRANVLCHTHDVAEATCPRCIEAAAEQVEDVLEQDDNYPALSLATGKDLDSLGDIVGISWG